MSPMTYSLRSENLGNAEAALTATEIQTSPRPANPDHWFESGRRLQETTAEFMATRSLQSGAYWPISVRRTQHTRITSVSKEMWAMERIQSDD